MNIRHVLWSLIALCSISIITSVAGLAWFISSRQQSSNPQLAIISANSQITLHHLHKEQTNILTENALASPLNLPATSPDGLRLAYIANDQFNAVLKVINVRTGEQQELYRTARYIPFDISWSPDGKYIIFLQSEENALAGYIVPSDGSKMAQAVKSGSPLYFAWSPDSKTLLLHVNGHSLQQGALLAYNPDTGQTSNLMNDPGLFQAPAWSYDGQHIFYAAQPEISDRKMEFSDVANHLVQVNTQGQVVNTISSEGLSFLWMVRAPEANNLAFISRTLGENAEQAPLKMFDEESSEVRVLSLPDQHVTSFFWSPDAQHIAYLSYQGEYDPSGVRTWNVVNIKNGEVQQLATFQPNEALISIQTFFDAYTFAFSPWSPDSKYLSYGSADGIYVLDLAQAEPKRVGDGIIGVWTEQP